MKNINSPLVSVIMNCHNGQKYLHQSIKSIFNQNYKNWELIFFDNHSTDNSKKILLSFKDKRVKYFKTKKFESLYKARNLAIKKAKGKFISFLDSDDWWMRSKLKEQVFFLESKKVNFIYSKYYIFNQDSKNKKINLETNLPNGKITQSLLDDYKIGILSVMVNKKLFKKKIFNTKYNIVGDFDFFVNLSLKEKFYCIQKPLAYYRVHNYNYSRNIKTYHDEMKLWLKNNQNKFKKLNFSLFFVKFYYFKLKIKYLLKKLNLI